MSSAVARLSILILGDLEARVLQRLEADHDVAVWHGPGDAPSELLAKRHLLVVRSPHRVTAATLRAAPQLAWILRAGAGLDNIDLAAAAASGIEVRATPTTGVSVAELAFGLLLCLAREIPRLDAGTRAGEWLKRSARGLELRGKSLVVFGLGAVGQEVARLAHGFGMRVRAVDRSPHKPAKAALAQELGLELLSLEAALPLAEVLVVACPLDPDTRASLDRRRLALLPRGALLVNVARGGIVDAAALTEALESGHVRGAGLDVHVSEPPPVDALLRHPRVVATPHVGAQTAEAFERIGAQVLALIEALSRSPRAAAVAHA